MRVVRSFTEPPRPCSYLPGIEASLQYRIAAEVSPEELESMLVRGWRRFGPCYFRPACQPCGECVSIRIPVDRFVPTTSQRRARRRCGRLRIVLAPPKVDQTRLDLHRAWHAKREIVREWDPSELDEEEYYLQFAFPHPAARELAFYDGDRLMALGLCDVTPNAFSATYFFYHPDLERSSPGVANVLICAELAKARGIPYVYLGYRVTGCPSMRYKARFHPHELLVGRPSFDEPPTWVEPPISSPK